MNECQRGNIRALHAYSLTEAHQLHGEAIDGVW